jgi:hypothetical protein
MPNTRDWSFLQKTKKSCYSLLSNPTWSAIEYFDPSWSNRIKTMAQYITPGKSVLDLGCGKMWVRNYIQPSAYYPVDYADRGLGTIVCDFNKKEFPAENADIAFVSGAMEYVTDAKWFISCIAKRCDECVISYCLLEDFPSPAFRRKQAWVNDYSRDEIVKMFSDAGLTLVAENNTIPKNRIFHFVKIAV